MILEGNQVEKEDYQIVMLKENDIPGIIKMDVRYLDNESQYYYDISGKTSFKMVHEKTNINLEEMRQLVNDLLQVIQTLKQYMLDGKHILLDPEYIFQEKGEYYFCYYPSNEQDIKEEFHKLTEFFVREVNYKDEEGVHFAYTLHKATMEENYSIEEIMKKLLPEKEEEPVVNYVELIENTEIEESRIEESVNMWEPVKRFLEKSRRRKWGYSSEDL